MNALKVFIFVCYLITVCLTSSTPVKDAIDMELNKLKAMLPDPLMFNKQNQTTCTCGVFLSGQFAKGTRVPIGNAALLHEQENLYPCTPMGSKQCTNKCLETVGAK